MQKHLFSSHFFGKKLPVVLTLAAGAGWLVYTVIRAVVLSMTHDESGSFVFWNDFPIGKCLYSPECWRWANLHLLYVFLMKATVAVQGATELGVRLPALFGHVLYLAASYGLLRLLTRRWWLVLAGFVLLNANPYLVEFFSLARGYGLAMGWLMVSLYFFARFVIKEKPLAALGTFSAAGLGVLSNFTLLNYYACLLALFAGVLLLKYRRDNAMAIKAILAAVGWAALCTVVTFLLVYNPIRFLLVNGEFEWGVDSFATTIQFLAHCSLYGKRYFHQYNNEIFAGLTILAMAVSLFLAVRNMIKRPNELKTQYWLAAASLPFLSALATIAQHHLLGSQYPVNRTALAFLPLSALPVFLLFDYLVEKQRTWGAVLCGGVAVFCLYHFLVSAQFRSCSEWSYDSQTKAMMFYLHEKIPPGQVVKLGVNWHFHPTANFYRETVPMSFCEPLLYSKEIRNDSLFDFYYIFPSDTATLHRSYVLEKNFGDTGWLMKRE